MIVRTDVSPIYSPSEIITAAAPALPLVETIRTVIKTRDYLAPTTSVCLPDDEVLLERVQTLATALVSDTLRYVFVVGIGGSNLGTKAIYDALYGYQDLVDDNRPRLLFLDAINPRYFTYVATKIIPQLADPADYLVVTLSKSGGTTETLANTEILLDALARHVGGVAERTVVITDAGSTYAVVAAEKGMNVLTMPPAVGGRYSVFSAVGLFPLVAAGIDVVALRSGATAQRALCLDAQIENNPALQSAAFSALAYTDGYHIHDTFVFSSELESLGKWYRQLLGESIGKEYDIDGERVEIGITPTVSIGSTDLHSVGQLYLGGPKDKFTTFVYSIHDEIVAMPTQRIFPTVVPMIQGKDMSTIAQAILSGVQIAYQKQSLPFMSVELEGVTPYELGSFMQYKMMEVMYLSYALNVNPFDQPHVELYKLETKQLLEQ